MTPRLMLLLATYSPNSVLLIEVHEHINLNYFANLHKVYTIRITKKATMLHYE